MDISDISNYAGFGLIVLFVDISGLVDPSELLANLEAEIMKAREESMSRKDIMDRINKWLVACDEETWLEEYNKVNDFCYNLTC